MQPRTSSAEREKTSLNGRLKDVGLRD